MAERPDGAPFPIGTLARRVVDALIANRSELLKRAIVPILTWVVLYRLGASRLLPEGHDQGIQITAAVGCAVVVLHFVISWHRLLQLGPQSAGHPFGIWIDHREWRLIGHGILFAVFWFVIHFAVEGAADLLGEVMGWIGWLAGNLLFYGFLSRHLLMFPMTAVDEEAKFGGSWDLTRPCWGPFVALIAVFLVPTGAIFLVAAPALNPDSIGLEVTLILQGTSAVLGAAIMATVLSVTYMELRPETPARTGEPGPGSEGR